MTRTPMKKVMVIWLVSCGLYVVFGLVFCVVAIFGLMLCGCVKSDEAGNSLLQTVAALNASDAEVVDCLNRINAEPITEKPEFWLKIISDSRYSDFRRRECMFELFSRHVRKGMPVTEVQKLNRVLRFSSSNLIDISPFAVKTPMPTGTAGNIYMFQNALLAEEHAAIYLKFSPGTTLSKLLQILQGSNSDNHIEILDMGISR